LVIFSVICKSQQRVQMLPNGLDFRIVGLGFNDFLGLTASSRTPNSRPT
jgi:hypothetical protein